MVQTSERVFVESELTIDVRDRAARRFDDHELKLWVHRSFEALSCYRISGLQRLDTTQIKTTVSLKISHLSQTEQSILMRKDADPGMLRAFVERSFKGRGRCKCTRDPKLIEI